MATSPILVDTIESTPATAAPAPAANAQPAQTPPDTATPDKYQGKTREQLAEMLDNAQGTIGRQSNEVGTMRRLVEQLAEIKRSQDLGQERSQPNDQNKPAARALTPDELLENPSEAIRRVMLAELAPLRESVSASKAEREVELLARDYPGFEAEVTTSEFQEWRNAKPSRREDALEASRGDARAARRLLESWTELKEARAAGNTGSQTASIPAPASKPGASAARAAATEVPGSGGTVSPAKIYNQADIVDMIIKNPDKYKSTAFQAELRKAAKEGRIQ